MPSGRLPKLVISVGIKFPSSIFIKDVPVLLDFLLSLVLFLTVALCGGFTIYFNFPTAVNLRLLGLYAESGPKLLSSIYNTRSLF